MPVMMRLSTARIARIEEANARIKVPSAQTSCLHSLSLCAAVAKISVSDSDTDNAAQCAPECVKPSINDTLVVCAVVQWFKTHTQQSKIKSRLPHSAHTESVIERATSGNLMSHSEWSM